MPAYESGEISALRPRYIYPAINTANPAALPQHDENNPQALPSEEPSLTSNEDNRENNMAQLLNPLDIGPSESVPDEINIPPATPPLIRRPIDDIIAAERALLNRQGSQSDHDVIPPSRTISEDSTHSQYDPSYLLYGAPRNEDLTSLLGSSTDQIQLSREIQRQQLVAEMGFELPSIPASIPRVSSSNQLQHQVESSSTRTSSGDIAAQPRRENSTIRTARKGSISTFFTNMFNFNKNSTQAQAQPVPEIATSTTIPDSTPMHSVSISPTESIDPPITVPHRSESPKSSTQAQVLPPSKKFFQFSPTSTPERKKEDDETPGYSIFKRKSISLFQSSSSAASLPTNPPDVPSSHDEVTTRPRSLSEGASLITQRESFHEVPQMKRPFTSSLKEEVKELCNLYQMKDELLKLKHKPPVTIPNKKQITRSTSSPAILTRLSYDDLICQLTPEQIQLIRRRRKNIGNYSSEAVIGAVTRARAMSGTSSVGDDLPTFRERSLSNVSIRSTQSTGYGSTTRERGFSDCSVGGTRYLTPQQQQLHQRRYQNTISPTSLSFHHEEDEESLKEEAKTENDSRNSASLTSSIYNILIQTISPRHDERKTSISLTSPRDHRSDSNTTTNTSSTSSGHHSQPQSHSISSLGISLNPEQLPLHVEEMEEEVKRIEECYQENPQEFSVFGVIDDDDD